MIRKNIVFVWLVMVNSCFGVNYSYYGYHKVFKLLLYIGLRDIMKETKVIKLEKATYDRLVKEGKPYKLGDTINTVVNRVLDKLESYQKKK